MNNSIDFLLFIGQLKNTVRAGWVNYGINNPESVSDHMYRMAVMSFLLPALNHKNQMKIDNNRIMKMALIHDLAECIVGDITPNSGYSKIQKLKLETDAMIDVMKTVRKELSNEIMELWNEYNNQTTEEAKITKDFDRFDMILQAYEYEKKEKKPKFLQDFFDSTEGKFNSDLVKGWVQDLYERRKNWTDEIEMNN